MVGGTLLTRPVIPLPFSMPYLQSRRKATDTCPRCNNYHANHDKPHEQYLLQNQVLIVSLPLVIVGGFDTGDKDTVSSFCNRREVEIHVPQVFVAGEFRVCICRLCDRPQISNLAGRGLS